MLHLKDGVTIINIENNVMMVDTHGGRYMALNRVAHEMIQALTVSKDEQEALFQLQSVIMADEPTLSDGVKHLKARLAELGLVA